MATATWARAEARMVSGAGRDPDEAFAGRPGEAPAGDADPLGSLVLDAEWAAPGGFPESPVEEPPPDRADDPLAVLEEIYRAEGPRLYGVVLAAVRSPDVAEDVVQEAFLRLVREISRRGAPDNPRAWLVRVALNAVASQGRRSRSAERFAHRLVARATVDSAEERALERARDRAVGEALRALPADARVALLLAAQGYPAHDIALVLGRSDGAVRTLLCRARLRLRGILAGLEGAP